jgi:hypothetical protein
VDGTSPEGLIRVDVRDVGSRVVLRYRLAPQDHGPYGESMTDLVGELLEWTAAEGDEPGRAVVRRRTGEAVAVALDLIVTGKVIPVTAPQARNRRRSAD